MNKKYVVLFLSLILIVMSSNIAIGVTTIKMDLSTAAESYELQTKDQLGVYFDSSDTKWQGSCIAGEYIVICAINDSDNGNIYVFDKNSTNVEAKCKFPISGHHCNSITYDSKRSLLIVSAKKKPPLLFELDKDTGIIVQKDFTFTQIEEQSDGTIVNPTTIAYNADKDNFVVLYSYLSKYYIYSSEDFYNNNKSEDVKSYSCKKYNDGNYCQQAAIRNNCLFYTVNTKPEATSFSTKVYVYDLLDEGTHIETITENDSTYEMEGITFDPENDTMYVFYRSHNGETYKKFALYKTNILGSRYDRTVATFDGNGGTDGDSIMKYGSVTLDNLPTSTRNGYTFDGWYTERSGGTKIDTGITISENTTFYAHWNVIESWIRTIVKSKIKFLYTILFE